MSENVSKGFPTGFSFLDIPGSREPVYSLTEPFSEKAFSPFKGIFFFHREKGICFAGVVQESDGHIEQPHQGDSLVRFQ